MKETKYYWKVVRVLPDGRMFSAIVKFEKYCVEYKIGEVSGETLVGNGLLVFETREQARKFKRGEEGEDKKLEVVKVMATGFERTPSYYLLSDLMIDNFSFPSLASSFPDGTRAFSKIKVIEKSH